MQSSMGDKGGNEQEACGDDHLMGDEPLAAAENVASEVDRGEQPQGEITGLDLREPQRDRIVVLGRRGAGKTIYLSRLYEQLWRSTDHLRMKAVSGETHRACMDVVAELRDKHWPASTLGTQYQEIELAWRNSQRLLVALDYPGEVFRKAFVEDADSDDVQELLGHIDRAAGVVLLLDPGVMYAGTDQEAMDDDFGMVQAVRRIREWPGGQGVPIAIVLTKSDRHQEVIRSEGGLKEFVTKHYPRLLREVGWLRLFACSAVREQAGENGQMVPSLKKPPVGVVEPLEFCLRNIENEECRRREEEAALQRRQAINAQLEREQRGQRRAILFWSIFWSGALVLLAAVGVVTWLIVNRETLS